jgi:AAA+ ATPase superfamily predicted ATPase
MLVGRHQEQQKLTALYNGSSSEFLVVYGRRRVGKTFLLREFFKQKFSFYHTGMSNKGTIAQLENFDYSLSKISSAAYTTPSKNWIEAFRRLSQYLEKEDPLERKVIFIDEMPWLDTRGSDFISGLEYFWNSWASARKDILLIVCGSATGWITSKLINNVGGLHNRVTAHIKLVPFTLKETEEFFESKHIHLDQYSIIQLYMAIGGIPFYLNQIKAGRSAAQNIDELFFKPSAVLKNEFSNLYKALFRKYEVYEKVVSILSTKTYGMTRKEIIHTNMITSGGTLTKILNDLEESGFILSIPSLDKTINKTIYKLSDYYTLFYFRFLQGKKKFTSWNDHIDDPYVRAWQGITFEQICIDHLPQIKAKLSIAGIQSEALSWRGKSEELGSQIDLLIDRRDQVINICEAKFSINEYEINLDYSKKIREKIGNFKQITKTKKSVFFTMITTFGLKQNQYTLSLVQNEILMEDLFR